MLIEARRESAPGRIVEQRADASLELDGTRLHHRLDSFARCGGDETEEQIHENQSDRDIEDYGSEQCILPR